MRTDRTQVPPLVLAEQTFAVLWEKLGAGDPPRPLFIPSPGATERERARVEHTAALDLVHHGIGYGAGSDQGVEDMLSLLARPSCEYYGWLVSGDAPAIGFVAATDGRGTVVAELSDGFVHLAPVGTPNLTQALCAGLSLRTAPQGQSGTATTAVTLPRTAPGLRDLVADAEVRAQFFVAVRDGAGCHRRSGQPVGYAETPRGSWLFHTVSPPDQVRAVPATTDTLATVLDQTRDDLAAAGSRARRASPVPTSPRFPVRRTGPT